MNPNSKHFCWILFIFSCCVEAAELPLWEAGVGVGAVRLPDYRGSNEQRVYALPFPYLVYRGESVTIDRRAIRGLMYKSERAELDLSFNASPPVKSDKNQARAGMPDLDPTFEVGPSLKIKFDDSATYKTQLILPVRAVVATNLSHAKQAGFVFNPVFNFDWRPTVINKGWNYGLSIGPVFATKQNHDYFYTVAPAYATPSRPAYSARGGYSGSQLTLSASRHFENVWVGTFIRGDDMHGTAFADSPLVKTKTSFTAGFGISWIFQKSKELVTADE